MKIPNILTEEAEKLEMYYRWHYPALAPLAKPCFLNTIETTVRQLDDGSYFVITGDIPAMWLRDSAAQVTPYVRFAKEDAGLQAILEGVIEKQAQMICVDPYANAFNESANGANGGYGEDVSLQDPFVWERKYEVDSLCAPLYLGFLYWKTTGIDRIFTENYRRMMEKILETFTVEQDHSRSPYSFFRPHTRRIDTLAMNGRGRPVNITGMTWSGFRPSDDACTFGYLVSSNMMAAVALTRGAEICETCFRDTVLAGKYRELAAQIREGIEAYAIVEHPKYGRIYAYETDGFGNHVLMDDANSPSLLSMPYLGYCKKNDPLYRNTRNFVLSRDNPYYYVGRAAEGVGSPHTPKGFVWHIGIIMQALTSEDPEEIEKCLARLAGTHAGTGYMHESFHPDAPDIFTRPWFAWANTLFAELLENLKEERFFD